MSLAMAATYDPDPGQPFGVRLPVTLDTCERLEDLWANWLAWDPLTLVETHFEGLKGMKALFIDCGDVDQYDLVYGARRLHRRLRRWTSPIAMRNSPTPIPASTTAWMSACPGWPGR